MRDDLRTAWRALLRAPAYSLVIITSLALGLGAALAAFAVLDAVRLRALPFPEGDRLVLLAEVPAEGPGMEGCGARCDVAYTTFADVLRHHPFRTVDGLIGFTSGGKVYMAGGEPLPVNGGVLTPEAFSLLRVTPFLGRALQPADDQLGVPLVTVLAHDFWTNQFGADPAVVGRTIKLSDSEYTVVGVMPPGFDFESGSKFWLPAVPTLDPSTRPSIRSLSVIARLAPGHTLRDLRDELARVEVPAQRGAAGVTPMRVVASPLRDRYIAATRSYDLVFGGLVASLLVLVVANLSNLSLVRALDQRREVAVRAALGAAGWRLGRTLALQHLLLVVGGTAAGLLVAQSVLGVLASVDVLASNEVAGMAPRLDARGVAFAVALALVVGATLAVAPVLVALRAARVSALRASAGNTQPRSRWQRVLVTVQVAMAFGLVAIGVVLRQSSQALGMVSPGFDAAQVVQGAPSFPHPWRVPSTYVPVTERILVDLAAMPGVRAATRTIVPRPRASFAVEGQAALDQRSAPAVEIGVTPGYFDVLGVSLMRGRDFSGADAAGGAPVAIVNALAAERWWPGADPIGRTVRVDTMPGAGTVVTIVGVVANHRAATALTEAPGPEFYRPWAQLPSAFPSFVMTSPGDVGALLRPMRDMLVRHVPDRPVGTARAIDGYAAQWRGMETNAAQAGWIALVGLAIAWLGLHGITAYGVRRRAREIGIRGAIGASRWQIARLVVADVAGWGAIGLAIGVPLALSADRLLDGVTYQARVEDPVVLASVACLVLLVIVGASLLPLRRALSIPAAEACRAEDSGT